jgi:hypothetical protein
MKYIPNAVTVKFARQLLIVKKNSPAILFGAGVATGLVATVKACQATLKVDEVLKEAEKTKIEMQSLHVDRPSKYRLEDFQRDQKLIKVHVARDLTKLYAVPVGLGIVSIGLLTGAHIVLTKRNVALAAAYAGLDKVFNEYRSRVRKELGEDKDREFRYGVKYKEIVEETDQGHEVKTVKRVGLEGRDSMYAKLFDQSNPNWDPRDEYNRTFLYMQQCFANNRLQAKGHVMLNDVYDDLGLPRTTAGAVVGWVKGGNGLTTSGDGYIDFGIFDPETQEIKDFMRGDDGALWIDPNVDGEVFKLIDQIKK